MVLVKIVVLLEMEVTVERQVAQQNGISVCDTIVQSTLSRTHAVITGANQENHAGVSAAQQTWM